MAANCSCGAGCRLPSGSVWHHGDFSKAFVFPYLSFSFFLDNWWYIFGFKHPASEISYCYKVSHMFQETCSQNIRSSHVQYRNINLKGKKKEMKGVWKISFSNICSNTNWIDIFFSSVELKKKWHEVAVLEASKLSARLLARPVRASIPLIWHPFNRKPSCR